jgi:uncharacterized protein (DUF779 family)
MAVDSRLSATPAASVAIARLREIWGPLVFVVLAGCRASNDPLCYPAGPVVGAEADLLIGEVDGCRFTVDRELYRSWRALMLILDVEPGTAEGFSLPPGPGMRFVVRGSVPLPGWDACTAKPGRVIGPD